MSTATRRRRWKLRASGGVEEWRMRIERPAPPPSPPPSPTHEQIAVRAYELYEQGASGDADAHWLAAERELEQQAR